MCILQLYPACYYTLYAHTSWKTSVSCVLWVAAQFIGNLELLIFKRCSWAECSWDLVLCSVSVLLPPQKRNTDQKHSLFFYFLLSYLFLILERLIHAEPDVQLLHTIWKARDHWPSHWHLPHGTTWPTLEYLEGITEVTWNDFPGVIWVCHIMHMVLSMQNSMTLHWRFQSKCPPLSCITCRYSDLRCLVAFSHLFPWIALSHCMQLFPNHLSLRQNSVCVFQEKNITKSITEQMGKVALDLSCTETQRFF